MDPDPAPPLSVPEMQSLTRVSKKHHRHINNPFPCAPKSLPFMHGSLSFNPKTLSQEQSFQIGDDFRLGWDPRNGGSISISHQSQPGRSIWSTVPGEAFLSAAAAKTEVEESRGSFAIQDGDVIAICKHQSIEDIMTFHQSDNGAKTKDRELLSGFLQSNSGGAAV